MKKFIGAVAFLAVMAGSAAAQGGGGGGMGGGQQMDPAAMAQRQIDMLFKDITLTDANKAKAVEIITKAMTESRGIDRAAADAQEKRAAITKKRNDDLKALLSDADKAKFDANVAAMPAGGGRGRPPVL